MYEIKQTPEFEFWLRSIRDPKVRGRLLARIRKVSLGDIGDVVPIASGIWEMREHFGSGWRMYYMRHGKAIILMLGGGSKSTQEADIKRVKRLLQTLEG
jgi:putative addiction module killer protein